MGANIANQFSQANLQKGFGSNAELLGGLNFPSVGRSGHIFNKQSQVGTQFGGRKKREAQFTNIGSGVGTQIGFDGSTFSNQHSQIGSQLASKGANIANQFSQANLQKGFGNNAELLSGLNFPTAVGSGHIFNKQSQIGTQLGGRKKREAQFTNIGSGVGTQVGFDGSTFSNL